MKTKLIIMLVLLSSIASNALAVDFKYKTTFWWNTIELDCSAGMCKVFVNGDLKGENPYTTKGIMAYTSYKNYDLNLNLKTGDYTYTRK